MNFREERGSTVVEFIAFVLIGQLLIFSGGMQVAESMDLKVRLELLANQAARALALGKADLLVNELKADYNLESAVVTAIRCPQVLACVRVSLGDLQSIGVSRINA